jgi:UDPglucose 6-dehydrogenase
MPGISSICCLGARYVVGPTFFIIAQQYPGITVTVVEKSVERIKAWNSDILPTCEPRLQERVDQERVDQERVDQWRGVKRGADLIFICDNTPINAFGLGKGKGKGT